MPERLIFGDAMYYQMMDYDDWKEESREDHEKDERHEYEYSFVDYIKA